MKIMVMIKMMMMVRMMMMMIIVRRQNLRQTIFGFECQFVKLSELALRVAPERRWQEDEEKEEQTSHKKKKMRLR